MARDLGSNLDNVIRWQGYASCRNKVKINRWDDSNLTKSFWGIIR